MCKLSDQCMTFFPSLGQPKDRVPVPQEHDKIDEARRVLNQFRIPLRPNDPLCIMLDHVESPPEKLRARKFNEKHVDRILDSFYRYGFDRVQLNVQLLAVDDKLNNVLKTRIVTQDDIEDATKRGVKFYAIVGDHSQLAMKKAHLKFPEDDNFLAVEPNAWFVLPSNHNAYGHVRGQ